MIVFPPNFVKTRYPGYFWNLTDKKLYSIKSGMLKPLAFNRGGVFFGKTIEPGYQISVAGVKRKLTLPYLHTLSLPVQNEIVDVA